MQSSSSSFRLELILFTLTVMQASSNFYTWFIYIVMHIRFIIAGTDEMKELEEQEIFLFV